MKSIIAKLRTLNDTDLKLQTIHKDLERLPKELAVLAGEIQVLRDANTRRRNEVKKLKLEAEGLELELKAGDEALKRFGNQLGSLRTSRELEAVRRQISTQKMFNGQTERKALELLEKADAIEKEAQAVDEQLKEKEQTYAAEHARVENDMHELKAEKEALHKQRDQLSVDIPKRELAIYDRIVVNRGHAIAHIENSVCSACFMRLPPQIQHLALMANELVTCPSCGRILAAG